jgi:HK97 family phage major capsid protein
MTADEMQKMLADEFRSIVAPMRAEIDAIKGKVDPLDQEKWNRMADAATKIAEIQQRQAALEAAMKRPGAGGGAPEWLDQHKAAFDAYLREGEKPAGVKVNAEGLEVRAMQTNVNPDGGYLVRPELAQFVVDRVFETSPLRLVARVETTSSKSMDVLVDDDEAGFRWANEGGTGGETTTPQLGTKAIVAHKMVAEPRTTCRPRARRRT